MPLFIFEITVYKIYKEEFLFKKKYPWWFPIFLKQKHKNKVSNYTQIYIAWTNPEQTIVNDQSETDTYRRSTISRTYMKLESVIKPYEFKVDKRLKASMNPKESEAPLKNLLHKPPISIIKVQEEDKFEILNQVIT